MGECNLQRIRTKSVGAVVIRWRGYHVLQRGEAPARADVLVGRVPAVVAVVQWEGRVGMYLGFEFAVAVVPVVNHSLSSCAEAYVNKEGRGRRSEGRQRKRPHGFMSTRTTQILWICLHPQ